MLLQGNVYGKALEVFANKSLNHGKVKYRVDDGAETLVDLYESSRTTPQSVYKAENLTEGEHTLYAVTQKERSGSAVVNQVAYVQVTHSPYIAKDFKTGRSGDFLKCRTELCNLLQLYTVLCDTERYVLYNF